MAQLSYILRSLALLSLLIASAMAEDGWTAARATWFDVGNIKNGNCHYDSSPTWPYVAALSDSMDDFDSSCGRCYEIRCANGQLTDGYGQTLDRTNACIAGKTSVVVQITDACPCQHSNAYSNKRWCCGDANHIDISPEAFRALANPEVGVIGLEYRVVSCDTKGFTDDSSNPASSVTVGGSGSKQSHPTTNQGGNSYASQEQTTATTSNTGNTGSGGSRWWQQTKAATPARSTSGGWGNWRSWWGGRH